MHVSRLRASRRWLTVVTFGALVLTGCGDADPADPPDPATAGGSATPSAPADAAATPADDGESPEDIPASWAGTVQFVQIDDAWTSDGQTYLSVRPAQKEVHAQFDTWVITPGEGPYTTVPMTEGARVLLTAQFAGDDPSGAGRAEPVPYSPAEFVDQLTRLDSQLRPGIGYDLSLDGEGRVTRLESLYTP
jgi:hypothetical protein